MQVLYGVDAQNLEKAKVLKKCAGREDLRFDHVAFYFPHVGKQIYILLESLIVCTNTDIFQV